MTDKVKTKHEKIYAALAAFQGELPVLKRTATVSFGSKGGSKVEYTYTPLGDINEVVLPLLAKNGLSVQHRVSEKGINCIVTHESASEVKGETISSPDGHTRVLFNDRTSNQIESGWLPLGLQGEMKDVGSRLTYARRYSLALVLGIASEEDKDVEIEEARKDNAEKFALGQVRKKIETVNLNELPKQIEFLEKELEILDGGKKAPSLGLTREMYQELIAIGEKRIEDERVVNEEAA